MSIIRTKHISDTDKFIRHYADSGGGGNNTLSSIGLHNQPGKIGSLSTSSGIKPVRIKNKNSVLEFVSDGVPPIGPITIPPKTVMKKRKTPQKRKVKTSSQTKKVQKPAGKKPTTTKRRSAGSQPPSKKTKRSLPKDVI